LGPTQPLVRRLTAAFSGGTKVGDGWVFERPDMFALLGPDPYDIDPYLQVGLWKRVPAGQIPEFLWEYSRDADAHNLGMFDEED
jgi:hypothetical protein